MSGAARTGSIAVRVKDPRTPPWECWREVSAECGDADAYRRRFGRFADELAQLFPPKAKTQGPRRSLEREWRQLGVNVIRAKLVASGGCVMRDGIAEIYVNKDEPVQRNRYTVAHELGHLLMDVNNVAKDLGIEGPVEESLCELFASRILIGRGHLRRCVAGKTRFGALDLLELCKRFGVSLSAMANALTDVWQPGWGLLLVGRQDTQESREYRVSAAVHSRPWFVPMDLKFSKLGMERLTDWMRDQSASEASRGSLSNVMIPLWNPGSDVRRSGRATISGRYNALRLQNGIVVVSLVWRGEDAQMHWYDRAQPSLEDMDEQN